MSTETHQIPSGVHLGDVLAGKYRIERILGVGGMGVVVAAHHLQLDEKVAIKFLLPEALGSAEAVARFEREARAAVKIKSEHVARVSDVGTLENGSPYMVMEFLEGGDLSAWLEQNGPLAVELAVEFLLQACEAIAEAHALGIVHRDLKPANLFVIRRADALYSIKVLDFGISKTTGFGSSGANMGMTKTNAVMGSPLYMSPEQMESSRNVDPRTDIWAIGVIFHELLTGAVPFNGDTLPEVCVKIATQSPPSLRVARPDISPSFEAVVLRCLEKDRTKRYANVAELAHALATFAPKRARASVERIARVIQASGQSVNELAAPPSSGYQEVRANTAGAWGTTAGLPPPHNSLKTAVVTGGIAVLALGGFLAYRGASSQNAPAPATSERAPASASPSPLPAVTTPASPVTPLPPPEPTASSSAASKPTPPPANPVRPVTPPPAPPARLVVPATAASARAAPPSPAPRPATRPPSDERPPAIDPGSVR
jgi:serine/threonine protein kinase